MRLSTPLSLQWKMFWKWMSHK